MVRYSGAPYDTEIAVRRHRPHGNSGMARFDRLGAARAGPGAGAFPAGKTGGFHAPLGHLSAVQAEHRLPQYHFEGPGAGISRRPLRWSGATRPICAGTRWPWWCRPTGRIPSTAATSRPTPRRRPCTKSVSITSGAPRARPSRRHGVHAGALGAGHLRARLSRGPPRREPPAALSPGGRAAGDCPPIRIRG